MKLIYGKSGTGKTTYCYNEISDKINENNKIYIITPEQFSFTSEKKLMECSKTRAVINAEVLTFDRMAYRVFKEVGGCTHTNLTNCGKSMLIYSILHKLRKELKFLSKTDENIEIINNTITELKKHNVTLNEIDTNIDKINNEYLKIKLKEIILLYSKYNENIENKYIDENDALTILAEKLDYAQEYNNAIFYIDEFAGFTKQEYRIIEKLVKIANQVNITICTDNLKIIENPNKDIFYDNKLTISQLYDIAKKNELKIETIELKESKRFKTEELKYLERNLYAVPYKRYEKDVENINIFLAQNQYSEIEYVAEKIINIIKKDKIRFKDIAIITKNLDIYSSIIKVIFSKYNIPIFIDEKKDLNQNLTIKYVLALLEIITSNWSYESVFNYLKIGFSNIDIDEIFELENYCINFGIRGSKWYKEEWTYGINDENSKTKVNRYNELRKEITEPIIEFTQNIGKNKNAEEITKRIYQFLIDMEIDVKIEEKSKKIEELGYIDIANEYRTGWKILMQVLEEIVLVFGKDSLRFDQYTQVLKVGLKNSELGKIPGTQDQVIIGDVDRTRSHQIKVNFIIGLNDGMFPSVNRVEGFFNDSDRNILKSNGIELAKNTIEKLYEENFNIYKAFSIAENQLYLTYSSTDIEGKSLRTSMLISRMKKIFINIKEESDILKKNREITTEEATFNSLLTNIADYYNGEEIDNVWFQVYNYYSNNLKWKDRLEKSLLGLKYTNQPQKIDIALIEKLYGNKIKTSVSKLEKYRSCPFSFHLKYGLKLQEQKLFRIQALDTGTFMHDVIDSFFNKIREKNIKPKLIEKEEVERIAEEIIEEKLKLNKNYILKATPKFRVLTNRLKRVIKQSLKYIIDEMKISEFEIEGNEIEFKDGNKYEPIKVKLENGKNIEIIGKIDRIDLAKNAQGSYIRIIDYKSSIKNIDLNEVVAGLQLQLLTYLDATAKVEDMIPAGILYFNLIDGMVNSKKKLSEEEIEEELKKQFKMKGLILADVNVVKMMDKTLEKGSSNIIPAYIDKEGNLSKKSSAISKEQFQQLQNYVLKTIKDITKEILGGNIELKPYYNSKSKRTPCEYCEYKAICQFNKGFCNNEYRYIYSKSNEEIFNNLKEKE